MQKYKEINGNDYVKNSRTTINETMQSIQSMNSGTAFPTNNLFEGMKCYRTDLKKTYTLTDVENNTWVEDAHATLSDEATHAASATKLQTARSLNLGGAVTADAATFDGTANATINVKTLDATKLKGTASVSTTGNAATATKVVATAAAGASANIAEATMASNDLARIRVSGATDAGELALETAADGSEPIVARQYTGIYTTPVRTAKILDESGNTSFPGTVVAPKFTGALSGNSATATKLQTPRTLSLSGKAAGSTTFDGSSNAAINVTSVNADTASKLSTARKINITGNASGSAAFDGTSDVNINVSVNESKHAVNADTAANANKLASESGSNYLFINTEEDNWSVIGPNPGDWLKSIRMDVSAPPYSIGHYSTAIAFGGRDTKGIITHAYNSPDVKFAGGAGSTASWKFTIHGGANNEFYDLNNFPTKTGGGASGTWGINISGNAATTTKLATARAISLTGNASGSANFDGSGNISINTTVSQAANADKVDGVHAASLFYNKGNWDANNWATMGAYQTNGTPPSSDWYGWGQVISSSTENTRFQLYASDNYASDGRLHYRTGWMDRKNNWNTILDSENYNLFAPTKTGGGASGTWGINITGNAKTATTASSVAWSGVTGKPGTYPPSAHNHDSAYPSVTGARASGTWGINISGNAASATNADKVDGYHASDIINKISAANTGGIVAASLTENGYVKFANGLILQWGNASGKNEGEDNSTTFPIAFPSTCFTVLLTPKRYLSRARLLSQSKTSFTWETEGGLASWVAVGN